MMMIILIMIMLMTVMMLAGEFILNISEAEGGSAGQPLFTTRAHWASASQSASLFTKMNWKRALEEDILNSIYKQCQNVSPTQQKIKLFKENQAF